MKINAQKYIKAGFSIVPINQGEKKPCIEWKEYQTRYPTQEEVDRWFVNDKINFGIVTGKISGITVVDIDVKSGGLETLEKLGLPPTWIVKTGGGGWHYYYKYCAETGQTAGIYQGVDIRNDGGQVVAPPSLHTSGNRYEWVLKEGELADFPKHLFQIEKVKNTDWSSLIQNGAKQGTRNQQASKLFGKLMNFFQPTEWETIVWEIAKKWNNKNEPPLTDNELRSVYKSIAKRAIHDVRPKDDEKLVGKSAKQFEEKLLEKAGQPRRFFSWGIDEIDNKFPLLEAGTYTVFFGQQGSGKTTYCLHIARKNSKKTGVTFLTTEMSREKMIELYCIKRAGITDEQYKDGKADTKEAIKKFIGELDGINFVGIDDQNYFQEYAIDEIQKIVNQNNPELLIIDNLDKIKANGKTELEVSKAVSAGILQCARQNGIAIILIHHANKMPQDKRRNPDLYQMRGLSGFRGTNKIADDADILIEIGGVNEKYLETADPRVLNTAKIVAYKDRNFRRKGTAMVEFKSGEFIHYDQFGNSTVEQFNYSSLDDIKF